MSNSTASIKMLEALRCSLYKEEVEWDMDMEPDEWREIFCLCTSQNILPMVYDAVYKCPAFRSFSGDFDRMVKYQVIRQVTIQHHKTEEFLVVYKKLLEAGLTPVIVKGIICRNLYVQPDYRCSSDEDILIPESQFRDCHEALESLGLRPVSSEPDTERQSEVSYNREGGVLHLELHKTLFPPESEAYGELNQMFDHVFERMVTVNIKGVPIYTLDYTDHMLYLILHAFKHFLHSGFGIRQVCDMILFADAYGKEIDWKYIRRSCRQVHAETFTAALFDIGKRELGFDPAGAGYPDDWNADGRDLLEDLMAAGVFGNSSLSRRHSSNMTLQAFEKGKNGKKTNTSLMRSVFPNRKYMERSYRYLRRYPFLLPAAWIGRIWKFVTESRKNRGEGARESIAIGSQRVELLKKYKIIQ